MLYPARLAITHYLWQEHYCPLHEVMRLELLEPKASLDDQGAFVDCTQAQAQIGVLSNSNRGPESEKEFQALPLHQNEETVKTSKLGRKLDGGATMSMNRHAESFILDQVVDCLHS